NIPCLTQLEFYTFRLFSRHNEFSTILHGGKLFQEFIVDAWAVTEQNRLRFLRMNQNTLRADLYQGLTDIVENNSNEELSLNNLGCRIILPSTHTGKVPNVVRLALHLPGMHTIVFDPTDDVSTILSHAEHQKTTLTAFFEACANLESARLYTYQEFLQHFVWNKKIKQWTLRKQGFAIGHLYFAGPSAGERFYLRLLLTSIRGPTSFEHLRTVNNIVHPTFKSACIALGLLENDQEWFQCLKEAAILRTGSQLRVLFAIILIQCTPTHPDKLWLHFRINLCDDLRYRLHKNYNIHQPTDDQVFDFGLFLLDKILHQSNQSLDMFPPMTLWRQNWGHHNRSHIIAEQLAWDYQKLQDIVNERVPLLNPEQAAAYYIIVDSILIPSRFCMSEMAQIV
ncbi:12112_t:CDS:2, partial [Cetraspora pellucida]